jgi:radical SAM protein with 4Fe4S-binding SPASM domain
MFSVILPVWNRADCVARSIESVIHQTLQEYELIVVDDGSQDGLEEVIVPYLSDRIKYFRTEHRGASAARNFGIERAGHPYIAHLDSDNQWHATFLERMKSALQRAGAGEAAAYCMARCLRCDKRTGETIQIATLGRDFNYRQLLIGNYIDMNTFVHSRNIVDAAGMFDENLERATDWDFIIRISSLIEPVFLPEILVDYYVDLADDRISKRGDTARVYERVAEKHRDKAQPLILRHNLHGYRFNGVSDLKYRNWLRMQQEPYDTSTFMARGFPYMLQIEPTNRCNLSCPLCPAGCGELRREAHTMRIEEFTSIVDDLEDYLLLLDLWDWGEPFLNPSLPAMVRYASRRGIKTITSTNAHFLHEDEFVAALLESGLTSLIVSLDSTDEESYRAYRRGGNLDRALGGLSRLIRNRWRIGASTRIEVQMVVTRHNEDEIASLSALAEEHGADAFTVKTVNPSRGERHFDEEYVPRNPKYRRYAYEPDSWKRVGAEARCERIWTMANILSNGDVVPCCYDYDETMTVGNVFKTPLSALWNGEPYREMRRRISGDPAALEKCRHCGINFALSETGWFVEEHSWEKDSSEFTGWEGAMPSRVDEIHRLEAALLDMHARLSSKEDALRDAENRLREVYASRSWRITRPLRETMRGGRSLKRFITPASGRRSIPSDRGAPKGAGTASAGRTQGGTHIIAPTPFPLRENRETGWESHHIFRRTTGSGLDIECHMSVLSTGATPHPPHRHDEEEALIVLAGEADLTWVPGGETGREQQVRLREGGCVYYPREFPHTITNRSETPLHYLMLKWRADTRSGVNPPMGVRIGDTRGKIEGLIGKGVSSRLSDRLFEGPTDLIGKLRCHYTILPPSDGYEPHGDPYDVAILTFAGTLETLGRIVMPYTVIFYPAGEPHGMKNVGTKPAWYLVFEFHRC